MDDLTEFAWSSHILGTFLNHPQIKKIGCSWFKEKIDVVDLNKEVAVVDVMKKLVVVNVNEKGCCGWWKR